MKKVIFDCDGVIALNSEEITYNAYSNLIKKKYNRSIAPAVLQAACMGLNVDGIINQFKQRHDITITNDDIMEIRTGRMALMRKRGVLKSDPSLLPLLEMLERQKIDFCVATASPMAPVLVIMEALRLQKYFPEENIYNTYNLGFKNKAELYQMLGQKLNSANNDIFIIEDSVRGITDAHNTNIGRIIAYGPNKNSEYIDEVKNKTIAVVTRFSQVGELIK